MAREKSKGRSPEGESTEAGHRGGTARSSDESPVMGVERRDCVIQFCKLVNQLCKTDNRKGGTVNRGKEGASRQNEVV